jgi:hypothetical protein
VPYCPPPPLLLVVHAALDTFPIIPTPRVWFILRWKDTLVNAVVNQQERAVALGKHQLLPDMARILRPLSELATWAIIVVRASVPMLLLC